jgi:thioredoxin-related protein
MRTLLAAWWITCATISGAYAQAPGQDAIDIPPWFASSFLDLREDVADAARDGRRLLVYFGQDGCPYCKQLMTTNFSQRTIVEKTRRHFVAVALDLWGDREVKWLDGRVMTEKELARFLEVQFTPTLLFFDEKGAVVVRLNGYYPPQRFEAVLDYVAGRLERAQPVADYLAGAAREPARPRLHDEAFFLRPPYDLRRKRGDKPLAVLFETIDCSACDELHREGFRRQSVLAQVERIDVVRFALGAPTALTTPAGRKTTAQAWARELGVSYTPSVIFFDDNGREVFRIEAYLRPFHFASSLAYVTSGAYRVEPSFQRYLQGRAGEMRSRGERVELWQ